MRQLQPSRRRQSGHPLGPDGQVGRIEPGRLSRKQYALLFHVVPTCSAVLTCDCVSTLETLILIRLRLGGLGLAAVNAATAAWSQQEKRPSLTVTAAMELIRSLMVITEAEARNRRHDGEISFPSVVREGAEATEYDRATTTSSAVAAGTAALSARFSEDEIKQAFGALRAAGWVGNDGEGITPRASLFYGSRSHISSYVLTPLDSLIQANPANGPNPMAMSAASRQRLFNASGTWRPS